MSRWDDVELKEHQSKKKMTVPKWLGNTCWFYGLVGTQTETENPSVIAKLSNNIPFINLWLYMFWALKDAPWHIS